MKIPFEFGIKLIFRLLFPGIILTLGGMPLILTVVDYGGWTKSLEYVLGFTVVFLGWLVTVSDMPIYMLFEGRRYWPSPLRRFFLWRERRRLSGYRKLLRLHETGALDWMEREADRIGKRMSGPERERETGPRFERFEELRRTADDRRARLPEAYFDIRNFPMSPPDHEVYEARYPTRLGNLMTAYEEYSTWAYGMDSVFYWYRIWLTIDKDTRDEIDNYQALADSTVYTSFALFCSGLLWLAYAGAATVGPTVNARLPAVRAALTAPGVTVYNHLPGVYVTWLLAGVFVLAGFWVYRISIRLHAQYGELFKAIFDLYGPKLRLEGIASRLARIMEVKASGTKPVRGGDRKEAAKIVTRYLQYHRVRCPHPKRGEKNKVCNRLLKPSEVADHLASMHRPPADGKTEAAPALKQ